MSQDATPPDSRSLWTVAAIVIALSTALHVVPQTLRHLVDPAWSMLALLVLDASVVALIIRSRAAAVTGICLVVLLGLAVATHQQLLAAVPSIALNLLMAGVFATTLRAGETPLIVRIAEADDPSELTPAFRRYLRALPGYRQSAFYADRERASETAEIPHETLEALTFEDERFDLVLSSDILEHVRRPLVAFQEIRRVLRPGGVNLFTVPLQEPLRAKTVWRVDTSGDTDEFPLPRHFHGDGRGGRSLVYVDFGRDLLGMLEQAGYAARFVRPETASPTANQIVTVMAVRA